MPTARIKIIGADAKSVTSIAKQIIEIAKATGVKHKGPVPLPIRRLKISTRKAPGGDGSHTYEHWEMRIHKWLVQIEGKEDTLRQVMRIVVPDTVKIEMSLS